MTEPADPDRFLDFRGPGAHEWWYFDSLSDDGRDGLVIVWYAALPFDPRYGRAAQRHLRAPHRHASPHPHDFCAFGFSWYRLDGSTVRRIAPGNPGPHAQAYALNSYRRDAFSHCDSPFSVFVASNRLVRDDRGYRLTIDTPDLSGRHRIVADLRFQPVPGSASLERDLGSPGAPHLWMLAAPDCSVSGSISVDGPSGHAAHYSGRGYHDHNAGALELSHSFDRWEWGRVHHGDKTEVYYVSQPRLGSAQALWITCERGRPVSILDRPFLKSEGSRRNPFGLAFDRLAHFTDPTSGRSFTRVNSHPFDSGPFYQRWRADFRGLNSPDDPPVPGISELLDGRRLHHPLFSWMIPFRLRRRAVPA